MNRRQIAAYITVCLVWGSTWAAIRIAVTQVAPIRLAAIRFVIAGVLMLPFALYRKMIFPRGRALKATLWLGLVMIGVQYALVFTAERYISSGLTAILYASSPLVVSLVSPRILGRPIPRAALTAMLVGVGGMMILLRSIAVASREQIVPALVMLVCVLISAISRRRGIARGLQHDLRAQHDGVVDGVGLRRAAVPDFLRQHARVQPLFLAAENGRAIPGHHGAIPHPDHLGPRRDAAVA
jgi:drug/metabolite transporter (DMT)-like permease